MTDSDTYNIEELTGRVQKCLEDDGVNFILVTNRSQSLSAAFDVMSLV